MSHSISGGGKSNITWILYEIIGIFSHIVKRNLNCLFTDRSYSPFTAEPITLSQVKRDSEE